MNAQKKINVGGQAVIEGVMMRSPKAFTIAVRRADGTIAIREETWRSLWEKITVLRKPFLRGTVVLIESMANGLSALSFSANEASREVIDKPAENIGSDGEAQPAEKTAGDPLLSDTALVLTIIVSFVLALLLFVGLPHFLTWGIGIIWGVKLDVDSFLFHIIDGAIKIAIFMLYLYAISFMPDIKRVFMYHGAEHKSIATHEAGEALTIENARKYSRFHPRCGTSFLINVLIISILIFSAVFPFVPKFTSIAVLNQVINVAMKIVLMLPIAAVSYEFIKYAGDNLQKPLMQFLIKPGLWMQKLTTIEPDDSQLEVALVSLRTALRRQALAEEKSSVVPDDTLHVIKSIDDLGF